MTDDQPEQRRLLRFKNLGLWPWACTDNSTVAICDNDLTASSFPLLLARIRLDSGTANVARYHARPDMPGRCTRTLRHTFSVCRRPLTAALRRNFSHSAGSCNSMAMSQRVRRKP